MADSPILIRLRRVPVTILVGATAILSLAVPLVGEALIYRRTEIAAGQWWRLWTGHLVHFTWSHLLADLVVFGTAGAWLEWLAPRGTRWFLVIAPAAVSALLYFADTDLAYYGGLSGLAVGLLVLLALVQLRRDTAAPRWLWPAVLVLVGGKIALEAIAQTPLVADFGPEIKISTLAHLGGVACALVAWRSVQREAGR